MTATRKGRDIVGVGALEARILNAVWDRGEALGLRASVRDVYEELRAERRIAYTTVMTVMGNLTKKGLLVQDRGHGVAYLYDVTVAGRRDELCRKALDHVLEQLLGGRVGPLRELLQELDTERCAGCGAEFVSEALHLDAEGLSLCPACLASCEAGEAS